jgi:hypothetical protein
MTRWISFPLENPDDLAMNPPYDVAVTVRYEGGRSQYAFRFSSVVRIETLE